MMMFQQQSCYMFVNLCLYLLRWNHLLVGVEAARVDRSSSPNSSSSSQSSLQRKVVDWLKSREGGFVNPKIEIRSFNPDDDNSNSDDDDDNNNNYMMTGIFAKEKIEEGEILITVPWDSLFDSNRNGKVWDRKSYLSCGTIENLIDEFKKHSKHQENGDKYEEGSEFGPYIEYLQNQPTGIIPSSWSENGQHLLLDILGGEDSRQVLPPMNPTHYKTEWIETCDGSLNDLYIAMFVLSRADEDVLVPVYDFSNHNNDPNKGNMMSVERLDGIYHQTKAKRTIEADEQIYNSYNLCDGCGTRHDMFGTPEIFDDYGFVEGMPQRWYFFFDGIERLRLELDYKKDEDTEENDIEDSNKNNKNKSIVANWNEELSLKRKNAIKQYFIHELRRLERLKRRVNTLGSIIQDKIPIKEWNLTWQYYDAIVDAMIYGYESLTGPRREEGDGDRRSKILEEICGGSFDIIGGHCSHYVNLTSDIEDDLPYELSTTTGRSNTPHNYELLEDVVSVIEEGDDSTTDTLTTTTKKTTINFQQDQEDDEICLFENNELIICPTSRPYVYEPLVHLPAQFLRKVKRVMIIGGGNGMALYELLEQYPNDIERIVVIEEYQQIARKSSEYFHTKQYFDNDKVEWWFVDTIEDVSLFVEGQIDLFDLIILDYIIEFQNVDNTMQSIACLLDDNGIFATFANEMRHIRRTFKYSVQVFPFDYAVVGKYGLLVLASHTVDFHHIELFDHEVEVYMYRKLKTTREFFYMTQNFYWNSHPAGTPRYRICKPILNGYEITEILEMNQIRKPKILTTLHDSLSRNGYEIKSTASGSTTLFALVLDEGYIIVSTGVPAEDASGYVGLDVHLWNSSYADTIQLRRLLIDSLEAKSLSSFRLLKRHRDSNKERPDIQSSSSTATSTTTRNTTIQEMTQSQQWLTSKIFALPYLEIEKEAVGVVCGGKEQECQSYNAAADISATGSVIRFWMCPELDDGADKLVGISSSAMEDCERFMMVQFDKATRTKKINVLVLDMSAGILMLKVVDSLLSSTTNRKKWLGTEYVVLALSFGEEANSSRRAFLDRIRQYIYMYPTARVELVIEREDSAIELGVVTSANGNAFGALVTLQKGLHSFFSTAYNQSSTPIVNITSVVGGVIPNEDFAGYDPQLQVDPTLLYPNGEDDDEEEGTNGSSERIRRYQTFARLQLSSTDQNIPRTFSYIEEVLEVLRHRMSGLTGAKQHKQIQSETGRTTLIRTSVEGITIISHDGSLGVVTINHHGPDASDPFIEMFLTVCKESEGIDVLSVDYHPRGLDVWTTSINTCHLNGISEPSCVATY